MTLYETIKENIKGIRDENCDGDGVACPFIADHISAIETAVELMVKENKEYKCALELALDDNEFGTGIEYCPARYGGDDIDAFNKPRFELCDGCYPLNPKSTTGKCWGLYFLYLARQEVTDE